MIITDESLLRRPCTPALPEEVAGIKAKLENELAQSALEGKPGIGLAAPQIGILRTMAIVRIPSEQGLISLDLVNCEISHKYDEILFEEGCLSFPNQIEKVKRFNEIHVINNLVEPHEFIATGLTAVCVQHELDHTIGILLPDVAVK